MNQKERLKMKQESDRIITITDPKGKVVIRDGAVTTSGKSLVREK